MKNITKALAVAVLIAAAGCSKSDEPEASSSADIGAVLAEYEAIRAQLAADKSDQIKQHAAAIERMAKDIDASAAAKPHLGPLGEAAAELAKTDPSDMAALRLAFGDLSEKLIGLLEAEPSAAEGLHTFQCPMAKGYKLWVQPNAELENPYMGQEMLTCGSEVGAN